MKFADLSPGMLVREGATLLKVLHVYTDHYGTARQVTLQRLLIERMNKRVQRRMFEGGHNITLDGTLGDEGGEQEKLDMLKSFGYDVNGILINASRGPSEQRRCKVCVGR